MSYTFKELAMERITFFLLIVVLFIACAKVDTVLEPTGIWVEQRLRLDTLDFDKGKKFARVNIYQTLFLNGKIFKDSLINPNFPINPSSVYSYYFKPDSIYLQNSISSSSFFLPYTFQMAANLQSFKVARFYNRNVLTTLLTFERIQ